jgi:hypothetical protein
MQGMLEEIEGLKSAISKPRINFDQKILSEKK